VSPEPFPFGRGLSGSHAPRARKGIESASLRCNNGSGPRSPLAGSFESEVCLSRSAPTLPTSESTDDSNPSAGICYYVNVWPANLISRQSFGRGEWVPAGDVVDRRFGASHMPENERFDFCAAFKSR